MARVAVVTGSNKGIGLAIVKGLCRQFDGDVYLTSRDIGRGQAAQAELEKEGLSPKFHQLNIDDHSSIEALKGFLVEKYGGLDVLVNNAGIAYKGNSTAPFLEQADVSVKTNFWATLDACRTLFPILKSHARAVNVSSAASTMTLGKCSPELHNKFQTSGAVADVERLMTQFVDDVRSGDYEAKGWPQWAYGMSKVGVTVITPLLQAELDQDSTRTDVVINSCCPGYVNTDMTSHKGTKTPDQGAETPLYLALLPPGVSTPRGEFVKEKQIVKWK